SLFSPLPRLSRFSRIPGPPFRARPEVRCQGIYPPGPPLCCEPNLRRTSGRLPDLTPRLAGCHKQSERRTDAVARLMPTKEVPNSTPGQPIGASMAQGTQDFVRDGVPKASPEDESGRSLAVLPERQSCVDMRNPDVGLPVKQGVD